MPVVDTFTFVAPTRPLRDWLKLQPGPVTDLVGLGATSSRIFATETGGLLPGGVEPKDGEAIAFHVTPGATFDNTLYTAAVQFDCYGPTHERAEILAAALATQLASAPPATRLTSALIFQGPAVIVDSFPLPVNINRVARQILRARLTFAAF